MNALEAASLVMIPSGYEDGTLGSLKPIDGSGDFTFSRGSNLSATRVLENGYIEKGYENLLLQSNQFDTTWSSSNFTLTPNQSGYDGSNDAWKTQVSTTYNSLSQNFGGSGVYTFSGYFRKGDSNEGIRFNFSASTDTNVYVDLTDGSSTFNGTLIERSITDVGNGFYKVVVTANLNNPNSVRIFVTNGGTTMIAGNIYIQDAQINQGLVALPYVESGATNGLGGLLENDPRIDFTGGGCGSLLLEPSRTNVITQSEYLNGISGLNKIGVSFGTNQTTSPEGILNSASIIADTSNGSHFAYKDFSLTSGTTYTISIYAKKNGTNRNLKFNSGGVGWSSGFNVDFDLTAGTATGGTIEPIGNDWYRCSVTGTTNATTCRLIMYPLLGNATSYQGDGTSGVFLYGFQIEQGSYPTSYIPTYGVSQTRAEDSIENPIESQPLGQIGQGTWFVELQKIGDDTSSSLYLVPTLSNTQQIRLHFDETNARFRDAVNGYATIGGGVNIKTSMTKMALSIDTNSGIAKAYANGSQLGADYTLQSNTFEFSRIKADGNGFILKQSSFFPTALTDSECIALTTI